MEDVHGNKSGDVFYMVSNMRVVLNASFRGSRFTFLDNSEVVSDSFSSDK